MTPLERADKVREALILGYDGSDEYLPPGSLILTPDEAEKVRDLLDGGVVTETHEAEVSRDEALALLDGKGQT